MVRQASRSSSDSKPSLSQDLLSAVGIDVGLIALIHTSDDETVAAPRFLRKMSEKLDRLHRRLSKAVRRSPKYLKILRAMQKYYCRVPMPERRLLSTRPQTISWRNTISSVSRIFGSSI